ncbi:MAG: CHASE4 domain-containing protein, partial [Chloroflexota bacterium]
MNLPRRRPRGARLPYHTLGAIALVLAATFPIAVMGIVFYQFVGQALTTDSVERTDRAIDAAGALVDRSEREIDELVHSYSQWPALTTMVEAGRLEAVRTDVLAFLAEQGSVSGGVVITPAGVVAAGPDALTAALIGEAGRNAPSPRVIAVNGQVFVMDDDPVRGSSADPGTVGRLVLARRLDARFAADLANLTGFAVGLATADGVIAVETDPIVTRPALLAGDGGTVVRTGDIVGRWMPLATGPASPMLIVASPMSALRSTSSGLPTVILALLAMTVIAALILAALLARVLRRRLDAVHDGLIAVADGRVPPDLATGSDDDIARLAA